MRVLHLISQYAGETGSGIYLQCIARESRLKDNVQGVVYGVNEIEDARKDFDYCNRIEFNSEGLPFSIVGMSDIMPYESRTFESLNDEEVNQLRRGYGEVIKKSIEEFKPDVIITNHLWIMSSMVKDLAKDLPVFGICHGTDLRQLEVNERFAEDVIGGIQKLDGIFTSSESQRKSVSKVYSYDLNNIEVIGGGYREDLFYFKEDPFLKGKSDYIELLYCGKLSFAKGVVELIKAVEKTEDCHNIRLNMVGAGTGEEYDYIRDMIERSKVNIRCFGKLTQKKLSELMREVDIFIMPSYYEGLSLVTIEALASGNLIVSNELSNLKSHLTCDINDLDFIYYVSSPKMETMDSPLEAEKDGYIKRLNMGIERQIARLFEKDEKYFDGLKQVNNRLECISWSKVYERLEKRIQKRLT